MYFLVLNKKIKKIVFQKKKILFFRDKAGYLSAFLGKKKNVLGYTGFVSIYLGKRKEKKIKCMKKNVFKKNLGP